jgi:hypothetical protein
VTPEKCVHDVCKKGSSEFKKQSLPHLRDVYNKLESGA